jgi:hypothetical protein
MARVAVAATTNGYHNDPKYSKGGSVRTDAGKTLLFVAYDADY